MRKDNHLDGPLGRERDAKSTSMSKEELYRMAAGEGFFPEERKESNGMFCKLMKDKV